MHGRRRGRSLRRGGDAPGAEGTPLRQAVGAGTCVSRSGACPMSYDSVCGCGGRIQVPAAWRRPWPPAWGPGLTSGARGRAKRRYRSSGHRQSSRELDVGFIVQWQRICGKLLLRLFVYDNCNTNSICCQTINNWDWGGGDQMWWPARDAVVCPSYSFLDVDAEPLSMLTVSPALAAVEEHQNIGP